MNYYEYLGPEFFQDAFTVLSTIMLTITVIVPIFLMFILGFFPNMKNNITESNQISDGPNSNESESDIYVETEPIPVHLGERMKYYEKLSKKVSKIPSKYPFMIRIDGRAFSKYTQRLRTLSYKKHDLPYSPEFKRCMIMTAHNLLHEFRPATVYTHSDEITLIFPPAIGKDGNYIEHPHGGKVNKLISLIASFASTTFYDNILREMNVVYSEPKKYGSVSDQLVQPLKCGTVPTFDARLIIFPIDKDYEIANCIMWRSKGDCMRNFVAMFAEKYIGKKKIVRMTTMDRKKNLLACGIDLDGSNVDYSMKHGIFLKADSEKFRMRQSVTRFYSFRNFKFSENILIFLLEKDNIDIFDILTTESDMIEHDPYQALFDIPDYRISSPAPAEKSRLTAPATSSQFPTFGNLQSHAFATNAPITNLQFPQFENIQSNRSVPATGSQFMPFGNLQSNTFFANASTTGESTTGTSTTGTSITGVSATSVPTTGMPMTNIQFPFWNGNTKPNPFIFTKPNPFILNSGAEKSNLLEPVPFNFEKVSVKNEDLNLGKMIPTGEPIIIKKQKHPAHDKSHDSESEDQSSEESQ